MGGVPHQRDAPAYSVYFLGNSHTAYHDVPGLVRSLLESGSYKATIESATGGHLDDIEPRRDVRERIAKGRFTHVVLQGASISSSHKYEYSLDKPIALAKRAVAAGAKPLMFAEWPRKGWDESGYIYKHYDTVRKEGGGEVMPVCYAWDAALKANPSLDLWDVDGNHSKLAGAYLAACTIAFWIAGHDSNLTFTPKGIESRTAKLLRDTARTTVKARRKA